MYKEENIIIKKTSSFLLLFNYSCFAKQFINAKADCTLSTKTQVRINVDLKYNGLFSSIYCSEFSTIQHKLNVTIISLQWIALFL